jgi:SAM-dependent methyltransferase
LRLRPVVTALRRRRRPIWLGSLGRTRPVSLISGYDRGLPVDRWYIDAFLAAHAADISGRVLEVKDSGYTERFGRGVSRADVLDIDPDNPNATIVADLAAADSVASEQFDCFVLTQTLQFVYDLSAALRHIHRILRPGGVLLATLPVTSGMSRPDEEYWRFTPAGTARLVEEAFGAGAVTIEAPGNVLSQIAFLSGLAAEDLTEDELAVQDPTFPLLVCVRAVKG